MLKNVVNLKTIDGQFEGKIKLENWQKRFLMDLPIDLNIGGEAEIDKIEPHHIAAYEYLCEHDAEILQNILEEIFRNYETWQEEYGYNDASYEEKTYSMPDIENIDRLLSLITPKRIIILDIEKDGMAYYGVQFICTWDQDHNLGVMLHKNRIVDIGGDDTAFLSWIAEEDLDNAETAEAEKNALQYMYI